MTERTRYIALASEFESTALEIAKAVRDAIDVSSRRGVTIGEGLQDMAHALDQIARFAGEMLRAAKRGAPIDLESLQGSRDRYLQTMRTIGAAIERSLKIN